MNNCLFQSDGTLEFYYPNTGAGLDLKTTQVFRDPSAWYHLVIAYDLSQGTASNRVKIYVNGVQVTSFSAATYPSASIGFGQSGGNVQIGRAPVGAVQFDGYLAETFFIDGQQLTPSSFGETDTLTGVWKPKKYAGTYGTNGFYLNFSDNSAATAVAIGKDWSGNGNNWTPNNISVTAGVTYDSMLDVPTMWADGGNGRGNYAVMNALQAGPSSMTMSNANLNVVRPNGASQIQSTIGVKSGKWYCEMYAYGRGGIYNNLAWLGFSSSTTNLNSSLGADAKGWGFSPYYAGVYSNGSAVASSLTASSGSGDSGTIMIALDLDSGKAWWGKNGTWFSSGDPAAGTNATVSGISVADAMHFAYGGSGGGDTADGWFNFGQRPFAYTPPTGFKALNTQNLPEATIKKGSLYFDAKTYSGTGGTQSISNASGFATDLAWVKMRSAAGENYVWDTVRGGGSALDLVTNRANAEGFNSAYHNLAFTSTGFDITQIGVGNEVNASGQTYVAWQWKESASAGFDIVTFTAPASGNFTINHSLGVVPSMIIVKDRSGVVSWVVGHKSLSNQAQSYLSLSNTNAAGANTTVWGNTAPTSTQVTLGVGGAVNANNNGVAYLFAEVAGFSKFGSYTGNGSADGPFVYLGFRPKFVMVKRTDTTGNWVMVDTSRDTYNYVNSALYADSSISESSVGAGPYIDALSNGFKNRSTFANWNASGGTYIFAAFAENPFKNSLAR